MRLSSYFQMFLQFSRTSIVSHTKISLGIVDLLWFSDNFICKAIYSILLVTQKMSLYFLTLKIWLPGGIGQADLSLRIFPAMVIAPMVSRWRRSDIQGRCALGHLRERCRRICKEFYPRPCKVKVPSIFQGRGIVEFVGEMCRRNVWLVKLVYNQKKFWEKIGKGGGSSCRIPQ